MEVGKVHDLTLKVPFTAKVVGPTQAGKSTFLINLCKYANEIVDKPFEKIVYCYGEFEDRFHDLPHVQFVNNFDPYFCSLEFSEGNPVLLLIDDCLDSVPEQCLVDLFQKFSHHHNISVCLNLQHLYCKRVKGLRNASLNTQYLILMKTPRCKQNIRTLQSQMYPKQSDFFNSVFNFATEQPFSYLFCDMKSQTLESLRLRSGIFPFEQMCAYVPI